MIDRDRNTKTKQKIQMHGDVVRSADNIAKLGQEWDDLFERAQDAMPYLSRAWAETFISEKRIRGTPLLIVVWDGTKLAALLPLSIRGFCGIRVAEPIGTTEPSYLGLLADLNYAGAIQAVADLWVRERVAHAFCDKYLSSLDETTNELLAELANHGFTYKLGFRRVCPWIHLNRSFEDYLQKTKSGRRRRKLRYQEKQVFEAGDVAVVRYIGEDITPEVIARIAAIQQDSWMKRRGAAVLGKQFHQKLSTEMAKAGLGHIWLMTMAGDDVAFGYALVAHKKLALKWLAFKLKYESSLSFGKILTMQMIRDACQENIESFDFGLGDSEYKQFWATDNHDVAMAVAGRGVLGYLTVLCYRVMWRLAKQKWLFSLYHRFQKRRRLLKERHSKDVYRN